MTNRCRVAKPMYRVCYDFPNKMKQHKIEKSRKKVLLQNIALAFASLALFLIFLEIIFRWSGYGNLVIYQPDPKTFWKPLPNQSCYTKFGHKPVYINSKRTRGKNFNSTKPKGVYRIISLGDSRTFGWGLSEPETYSGLLEEMLQKYVGISLKIEVINAGVNAWSYAQMYIYLRDISIQYKPDMVLLADANLWSQFSEESSKEFREKMLWRVRLKNILRRSAIYHFVIEVKLKKFYEKYRTKFIPIDPKRDDYFKKEQRADPNLFIEEQIVKICELLINNNVKILFIYIPMESFLSSFEKPMILKIKEKVSKQYNINLVDISEDFRGANHNVYLPGDPVHPNTAGNKIIANRIFNFITSELNH